MHNLTVDESLDNPSCVKFGIFADTAVKTCTEEGDWYVDNSTGEEWTDYRCMLTLLYMYVCKIFNLHIPTSRFNMCRFNRKAAPIYFISNN